MEMDKRAVGMRVSEIRREKGLTLEEFGKIVDNAGKSTVSKWERGSTVPNNKRLKIIAEIGNTTLDRLMYGSILDFILYNLESLAPEKDSNFVPVITGGQLASLAKELEKNDIKISNIEGIKKTIEDMLPHWKDEFQKTLNNYLKYITNHKEYKRDVYEMLEASGSSFDHLGLKEIDNIFVNGENLSFEEKIYLSSGIEDIHSNLEAIVNDSAFFFDTDAFMINEEHFIKNVGELNLDELEKQAVFYKENNTPFPNRETHYEILVCVGNNNKCSLLKKNNHVLLHYFPHFKWEFLNKYFKETHITLVSEDGLYLGFLNTNLIFNSTKDNEFFSVDLNDGLKNYSIFPTAAIFY